MNYANYHQSQFDQNVKYMKRKAFNANPRKKFTEQGSHVQTGEADPECRAAKGGTGLATCEPKTSQPIKPRSHEVAEACETGRNPAF